MKTSEDSSKPLVEQCTSGNALPEDMPAGIYADVITDEDIHRAVNIAMRDLPWKPYLSGRESRHRNDVLKAYRSEFDSLTSTVLRELKRNAQAFLESSSPGGLA